MSGSKAKPYNFDRSALKHHKAEAGIVEALFRQEAMLMEQLEFWKVRECAEAERRRGWESELEAHRKSTQDELRRLHEERDLCQRLEDAERRSLEESDARGLSLQEEHTHAERNTELFQAELAVAKRRVLDIRSKIQARHRLRTAATVARGGDRSSLRTGELKFMNEAESDTFRDRIALELKMQLCGLPLDQVRPCVGDIIGAVERPEQGKRWSRNFKESKGDLEKSNEVRASVIDGGGGDKSPTLRPTRNRHGQGSPSNSSVRGSGSDSSGQHSPRMPHDRGTRMSWLPTHSLGTTDRAESPRSPNHADRSYDDALSQLAAVGIHM